MENALRHGRQGGVGDLGRFHRAIVVIRLGIGIAADAVPANTNLDRWTRDKYRGSVRSGATDDAAKVAKVTGTALVTVPVYAGAYGAGYLLRNTTITEWSQRSFRATLVGTPALLILQEAIGSDRPEDGNSHWRPFHGSHGVSVHAYIRRAEDLRGEAYRPARRSASSRSREANGSPGWLFSAALK